MKLNLKMLLVAGALLSQNASAFGNFRHCIEDVYARAIGGVGFSKRAEINCVRDRLNTGFVFAGAFGAVFPCNVRVEAEVAYRRHSIKQLYVRIQDISFCQPANGNFFSVSGLVNFIYDIPAKFFCINPYIGIGVGGAHNQSTTKINQVGEVFKTVQNKNGLAWQALAGLSYDATDCFDVALEYRYYRPNVRHFHDNNIVLSVRYHF